MRSWHPIPPYEISNMRLNGEHNEIHGMMSSLLGNRKLNKRRGYHHHPETKRWQNRLHALIERHDRVAREMKIRGMALDDNGEHRSPFNYFSILNPNDSKEMPDAIEPLEIMLDKLAEKESWEK